MEYLYLCTINNQEFDAEHSIKTELEECLVCKEKGLETHKPKRLIAGPTAGRVELQGRELIDKVKEDTLNFKKEVYGSEKKYANAIGESKYHELQTRLDRRGR
jgi:hypothetical protein